VMSKPPYETFTHSIQTFERPTWSSGSIDPRILIFLWAIAHVTRDYEIAWVSEPETAYMHVKRKW
jgi:hypothetical protein